MPRIAALLVIAALTLAGLRPLHCATPGGADQGAPGTAEEHLVAHGHAHGSAPGPAEPHPGEHHHWGDAPVDGESGLPCSTLAPCSATAIPTASVDDGVQRMTAGAAFESHYASPALHDLSTEPPPPRPASSPR